MNLFSVEFSSVFPAYVGMSPKTHGEKVHVICVPRIRGDEPYLAYTYNK